MRSLWNDLEAKEFQGDLGLRVYTSRLLGRDKSLVLHGGGNTSVKIREKNLFGEDETILYVKGSGWDLETIEPQGFSPVRLAHVLRLAELPALSDPEMVNQLVTHMLKASAPAPSIETILHGLMPQKFVDHTLTPTRGSRGATRKTARNAFARCTASVASSSLISCRGSISPSCAQRNSSARARPRRSEWSCSATASSPSARPRAMPTSA